MFSLLISSASAVASRIAACVYHGGIPPLERALRNASVSINDSSMY